MPLFLSESSLTKPGGKALVSQGQAATSHKALAK
jgi:hypothetical protein